jgi:hypothetical protein
MSHLINVVNELGYLDLNLIKSLTQSLSEIFEKESKDSKFEALINNVMESFYLFKFSIEKKAANIAP